MSSQSIPLSSSTPGGQEAGNGDYSATDIPTEPPVDNGKQTKGISPFWYDRLIEISLVLSMAAYYVIGNEHLGTGFLYALNPLLSLPFLLIFSGIMLVPFTDSYGAASFDIAFLYLPENSIQPLLF